MINNYNALPLGTFLELDEVFRLDAEEIDKQVKIVAILANLTEDEVLALPLDNYASMAAQTAFLSEECPPVTAPARVIVGELVLVPVKDFTKLTTAQYVDFQTFSKGGTAKLPELLSVLLVPEGKKYNEGYDIADVVKAVRSLSLPVALGLSAFFFDSLRKSIEASLTSLEETTKRIPKEKRRELLKTVERLLRTAGAGSEM